MGRHVSLTSLVLIVPGEEPHTKSLLSNSFLVQTCLAFILENTFLNLLVFNVLYLHPHAPGFVSLNPPSACSTARRQLPVGRPVDLWILCKTGLVEEGGEVGYQASPTGVGLGALAPDGSNETWF